MKRKRMPRKEGGSSLTNNHSRSITTDDSSVAEDETLYARHARREPSDERQSVFIYSSQRKVRRRPQKSEMNELYHGYGQTDAIIKELRGMARAFVKIKFATILLAGRVNAATDGSAVVHITAGVGCKWKNRSPDIAGNSPSLTFGLPSTTSPGARKPNSRDCPGCPSHDARTPSATSVEFAAVHRYTRQSTAIPTCLSLYSFNPLSISCIYFPPCKRIIRGKRVRKNLDQGVVNSDFLLHLMITGTLETVMKI
ncbi:hypothetical protein EAG_05406 [Camponotus floridanus]|uniref:Uncharacterized protein n=1 Tax=Camponotus floridanus TaxID=104421 RepID=E2A5Y8_CAMFO|nr:hypothetical protein EAG_05406 [Camponotus floridanus]